ncbi:MAG TPA: 2-oxo acid dehydrogenase subunit E2, partial [Candidatus Dormibacteraeota bacterium]|nr:2-oxo acid dehydrogenase subunit E2 [Candidatus Dormibacteraeota bacterium]
LEDTLVVPVIRRADGLSIAGLARAVNDVANRARNKQLKADDLTGGTFTVNNSGTFGTLFSYSVINPGQAGELIASSAVAEGLAGDLVNASRRPSEQLQGVVGGPGVHCQHLIPNSFLGED